MTMIIRTIVTSSDNNINVNDHSVSPYLLGKAVEVRADVLVVGGQRDVLPLLHVELVVELVLLADFLLELLLQLLEGHAELLQLALQLHLLALGLVEAALHFGEIGVELLLQPAQLGLGLHFGLLDRRLRGKIGVKVGF